jgi:hypothetical protein
MKLRRRKARPASLARNLQSHRSSEGGSGRGLGRLDRLSRRRFLHCRPQIRSRRLPQAAFRCAADRARWRSRKSWKINTGVLIFNMKHPQTARLIKTWKRLFDFCCAAGLLRLPPRLAPVNDQSCCTGRCGSILPLSAPSASSIRISSTARCPRLSCSFCAPTWKISSCASRSSRSACGSRSKPPGSVPRLTPPPPTAAIPVARPRRPARNRSARSYRRAARSCRSRW